MAASGVHDRKVHDRKDKGVGWAHTYMWSDMWCGRWNWKERSKERCGGREQTKWEELFFPHSENQTNDMTCVLFWNFCMLSPARQASSNSVCCHTTLAVAEADKLHQVPSLVPSCLPSSCHHRVCSNGTSRPTTKTQLCRHQPQGPPSSQSIPSQWFFHPQTHPLGALCLCSSHIIHGWPVTDCFSKQSFVIATTWPMVCGSSIT